MKGYLYVGLNKKNYKVHRIIWAMVNNKDPEHLVVDHINRDKLDNRITNLRAITHGANRRNSKLNKNSTSGYRGVTFNKKSKKWYAVLDNKHLGSFSTKIEAIKTRTIAEETV